MCLYVLLKTSEYIENTSSKVLAYGIYARVVDVSEIERVSAANELDFWYKNNMNQWTILQPFMLIFAKWSQSTIFSSLAH